MEALGAGWELRRCQKNRRKGRVFSEDLHDTALYPTHILHIYLQRNIQKHILAHKRNQQNL